MAEKRLKDITDLPVLEPAAARRPYASARADASGPAIAVVAPPVSAPAQSKSPSTPPSTPPGSGAPAAPTKAGSLKWPIRLACAVAAVAALGIVLETTSKGQLGIEALTGPQQATAAQATTVAQAATKAAQAVSFTPSAAHWLTLAVEPVEAFKFRESISTDAKIAINEDRTTPVFSPYTGQVLRLMVKPGDQVQVGTPLFTIKANDMVQAQNDYLKANSDLNTTRSALQLAEKAYNRAKALYEAKAGPQKDYQEKEDAFTAARNNQKTAEVALQAVRNRLLILGKSDNDVLALITQGQIGSEATVNSPIAGTIVQRKVGPGQYLGNGASDPAFIVGDLSAVWLIANVRETDAPKVLIGQTIEFTTLAIPNKVFTSRITYVAPQVDPASRRIQVRAEIPNPDGALKPEMFASVSIVTSGDDEAASVPRSALIYEGSDVRVWVARADKTIELRRIEVGLTNNERVQVTKGLTVGEKVVTKGSLFIDRIAKLKD